MGLFIVGDFLKKSIVEIERLPVSEVAGWLAYIKLKNGKKY